MNSEAEYPADALNTEHLNTRTAVWVDASFRIDWHHSTTWIRRVEAIEDVLQVE